MFVCGDCAREYGLGTSFLPMSKGPCEYCKETKSCFDVRLRRDYKPTDVPIVKSAGELALEKIDDILRRLEALEADHGRGGF
jgi:hypothetical protein